MMGWQCAILLLQLVSTLQWSLCRSHQHTVPGSTIRFIDHSYRKYVGKRDPEHPWQDGVDILSKRGHRMVPVLGEISDQPVTSINTELGAVALSAQPQFMLQDFHTAYGIPTIWPYCESVSRCLVYNQPTIPAYNAPVTIKLPAGVSAMDFYLDAAIDCAKTLRAVSKCKVTVQPGHVEVKFRVTSVCTSPNVGKYIGFLDESGSDVDSLTLKCKSTYPNTLGLIRIGSKHVAVQPVVKLVAST